MEVGDLLVFQELQFVSIEDQNHLALCDDHLLLGDQDVIQSLKHHQLIQPM
jgi:hypothetical protein